MFLPGWRALLEHRWRERLTAVTELSLAYHSAADRVRDGAASEQDQRRLHRLMREAVAARQALTGTEDALARLSAGRFGECEQCAAMIDAGQLARNPEERYCGRCAAGSPSPLHGAVTKPPSWPPWLEAGSLVGRNDVI
jgi:RNA polymerase-binding transcription factor DksA